MKFLRNLILFITILTIVCCVAQAHAMWEDISSLVEITEAGTAYDPDLSIKSVTVIVTNISGENIEGDLRLMVTGTDIPINPDGTTDEGGQDPTPYYDISTAQTGLMESGESSTIVLEFWADEFDILDYTLSVERNNSSIYRDIFRKNISKTPEIFSGGGLIKIMPMYIDGRSTQGVPYVDCNYYDCNSVDISSVDPNDIFKVKPIVVAYLQEVEDAEFNPVPDYTDEPMFAHDVFVAVSYDDGATWKRTNISRTARKSSFTLENGVQYMGDSDTIDLTVNKGFVFVSWRDKFAQSGNPWGIDPNDDLYQIMGPQRSVDYMDPHGDDDPRPDLGQRPFNAIWTCRGFLDPNLQEIVWFKADQITTGRRCAVRNFNAGLDDGGFAVSWQEDPKGLKTGKGRGPGAGMSGACVNHKTDIWYSYIRWDGFADIDPNFVSNSDDTGDPIGDDGGYTEYVCTNPECTYVYDPSVNLDPNTLEPIKFVDLDSDWTCPLCGASIDTFEKDSRPKTLVKMSPPVRVTNNAVCKERTPDDVWGYACTGTLSDGITPCDYTFSEGTTSNGYWADLPADWVCPKCGAAKDTFIGPLVISVKHIGGLWCEQFADNPRVDKDGYILDPSDPLSGYEYGFYTSDGDWIPDEITGEWVWTGVPLDGDTGASRPAISLVRSPEDPNQILVLLAYEETKGMGTGSDKVAMAPEKEPPVPEQFVDGVSLGAYTNADCISCHYQYTVPRDRIDPTITELEACSEANGVWDNDLEAYWPPLSTDGYIVVNETMPDDHPTTSQSCISCHTDGIPTSIDYYVGEPEKAKCIVFEVGKKIVPKDAFYITDADYYALPDHMPGWHVPVSDCIGCHLPFGTKDSDEDSVPDRFDNCPDVSNPDQLFSMDLDGDGILDSCGEGSDDHEKKTRHGKNLFYHDFPMEAPDAIAHGAMINLPNSLGYLENARRLRLAPQTIFDPNRPLAEQLALAIYYKQGLGGQGAPADGFLRLFYGGYDISNAIPYAFNMSGSTIVSYSPPDPNVPIEHNGHNVPKIEEYIYTQDNLYDDSGYFVYYQAVDEFGNPVYDEYGNPVYARDENGDLIPYMDLSNPNVPVPLVYDNPYENIFSARISVRGDFIVIAYAHCPNWAAAKRAKDTYNFWVRTSEDAGLTWSLPVNVTDFDNAKEGVSDCRILQPPLSIPDSPYKEDVYNEKIVFLAIGTQLNTPQPLPNVTELEESEVFLDLFYTRSIDGGKTFETVTWENANYDPNALPYLDADGNETDDPALAVKDNPAYEEFNEGYDWMAKGDASQGDIQVACSPDGSRLYAVWEHELEITEEGTQNHFQGSDVWFRKVVYDNTPPEIIAEDMIVEATSSDGAVVEFTFVSIDSEDDDPDVTSEPPPGSLFPIGDTTVTVTSTDESGNTTVETFTITVVDTTAPSLTIPDNIVVLLNAPATDASILESVSAVDAVDPDVVITHNATATSFETAGRKDIIFTATDDFGNQSSRMATISVVYDFYGFLTPLALEDEPDTQIIPIKYGKIVPVKFELSDYYGQSVPDVPAFIIVQLGQGDVSNEEPIVPEFVGNEDVGNEFRYVNEQYVFNLSTEGPGNPYPEVIIGPGVYTIKVYIGVENDSGWFDVVEIHEAPLHLKQ